MALEDTRRMKFEPVTPRVSSPSDVYFEFDDYNFDVGQPVRLIKRIDRYAQKGWSGDLKLNLVEIDGDIYD